MPKRILPDTTVACTVCGETKATLWRVSWDHLLGSTKRYRAVRCVRCGTRRLDPRPAAEMIAQFYAPETYTRAEDAGSEVGKRLDAYAERLAAKISAQGENALDVGCGDGRFLAALQKRGWKTTGTETDALAARLARERTHTTIYETPLPPPAEARFDLVSLLHVLEHVPNPRQTLSEIATLLAPGGTLLLVLPNAASIEAQFFGTSWYHLDLPRHLWGFTPNTLVRLVETCGFVVQTVAYTPFLFAPQSIYRALLLMNGVIPGTHLAAPGGRGTTQTTLFNALLAASSRWGNTFPGEIIELTATFAGGEPAS